MSKKIENFLSSLTEGDEAKNNWLIDREAELIMSGHTNLEAKEKALLDYELHKGSL